MRSDVGWNCRDPAISEFDHPLLSIVVGFAANFGAGFGCGEVK